MNVDTNIGELAWFLLSLLGVIMHAFWFASVSLTIHALRSGEVEAEPDVLLRFRTERTTERDRCLAKACFMVASLVAIFSRDNPHAAGDGHFPWTIAFLFLGLLLLDISSIKASTRRFRDLYGDDWRIIFRTRLVTWVWPKKGTRR